MLSLLISSLPLALLALSSLPLALALSSLPWHWHYRRYRGIGIIVIAIGIVGVIVVAIGIGIVAIGIVGVIVVAIGVGIVAVSSCSYTGDRINGRRQSLSNGAVLRRYCAACLPMPGSAAPARLSPAHSHRENAWLRFCLQLHIVSHISIA
ncbi:MAG: hypothetical protein U0Z44_04505 [Kouleothrix sp.]